MQRIITLIIALLYYGSSYAQSINSVVTQQPCNNNGIVTSTFTGFTNPITVDYYIGTNPPITHTVTSGNTDVLNGYSGAILYIMAYDNFLKDAITQLSAPAFNVSVNSYNTAICPAMASVPATVSGGAAPYTYNWFDANTNVTISTTNPATLPSGAYHLTVTDNNGCTVTTDSLGVFSQAPFQLNITNTPANCTNGTAAVAITGSGIAPYSYLWSTGATTTSINSLTQGSYNVTVTDAQGCVGTGNAYINQSVTINPSIVATPATCVQTNGAVASFPTGGLPPYSYLWNNLATTPSQTNIPAGSYMLTVTDANGCSGVDYAYVATTTPIIVTYTATSSLCTSPTGSATLSISGGAAPYVTTWSTFPAQTGSSVSNLAPGTYSFQTTDANGCLQSGTVVIPPVNIISATLSGSNPTCTQTNGSMTVTPTGGALPYTYNWSNSGTTATISGLTAGSYFVTITDNSGCSITKGQYLPSNSPVSIGLSTTPTSCIYANDGAIVATAIGGTAPYTWNTAGGSNTLSNLAVGYYSIGVTDANGCVASNQTSVSYNPSNNSCYCTITGSVYYDVNNNCTQDAGENGIPNIQMHLNGFGYTYTDMNGIYSFKAPSGSYTLSETVQSMYPLAGCQNNSITVTSSAASNCTQTYDFANMTNPLHDVKMSTWDYNMPIPGYPHYVVAIVTNDGTVSESNIVAGLKNDMQLSVPTITPSAVWVNNGPSQYNIPTASNFSLAPGATQAFYVDNSIPTNMPLSTLLTFKDTVAVSTPVSSWTSDYSPANNVNYFNSTVVGSFDPNFKEVIPAGDGPTGKIYAKDSVLEYMVHFQNLGTYTAFNIVVIDTLDADLDWSTLRPGYESHTGTLTMDENGVIKYSFNNINLPPKAWDDLMSNGMFTYSIKTKKNLPIGTQFTNNAAIYFDYNEAVITNTTINTLSAPTTTPDIKAAKQLFSLYPNPAEDICNVKINVSKASPASLKVTDLAGKVLHVEDLYLNAGEHILPLSTLAYTPGIYFVTVDINNTHATQKLVKVK